MIEDEMKQATETINLPAFDNVYAPEMDPGYTHDVRESTRYYKYVIKVSSEETKWIPISHIPAVVGGV